MEPYQQAAVMDDVRADAVALQKEFQRHDLPTSICVNEDDLLAFLAGLERAVVAVDLDMGENRRTEGISAIGRIKELQREQGHDYYVAALTSHVELKREAALAGADAFIPKGHPATDALEIMTRALAHDIDRAKRKAHGMQTELAKREYQNLYRQLNRAKRPGNVRTSIAIAGNTIRRALNWPFLTPNEQVILSALDEQLASLRRSGKLDDTAFALWLEGVSMLENSRAENCSISDWLRRLSETHDGAIFSWLSDEEED